ncbi:MAG: hypothetical protein HY242_01685 [Afipia sp.]|nr:hypothetical protein [Afipia sp.]
MLAEGRAKRYRFYVSGVFVTCCIVFAICVIGWQRISIVRLDKMFDPALGFSDGRRVEYFARDFPSSDNIKDYLSDATILHSHPPLGNDVFYFDKQQGFLAWLDSEIVTGNWQSYPKLQIILLGDRWRIAVVNSFCMLYTHVLASDQQDRCYSVESLASILARGKTTRHEYRKGNVFGLADNKLPPFPIPKSDITIDSLLSHKSFK